MEMLSDGWIFVQDPWIAKKEEMIGGLSGVFQD